MCQVIIPACKQIDFRGGTLSIVGSSIIRKEGNGPSAKVYEKVKIMAYDAEIKACDMEQESLLTSQIVLMSGGPCIITRLGPERYLIDFTIEAEGYIDDLKRFLESIRRKLNRCIDLAKEEQKALQKEKDKEL